MKRATLALHIMKLYLVQHGRCNPQEVDPEKHLSTQGRGDVEKLAAFLAKAGISPSVIFHSGKARARETAEILAATLHPEGSVIERNDMNPHDDVHLIARDLEGGEEDIMLIGHLPHLSTLTSLLLTRNEGKEPVSFQQGGIVTLERQEQKWTIHWMLIPSLLR